MRLGILRLACASCSGWSQEGGPERAGETRAQFGDEAHADAAPLWALVSLRVELVRVCLASCFLKLEVCAHHGAAAAAASLCRHPP